MTQARELILFARLTISQIQVHIFHVQQLSRTRIQLNK